MQDQVLGADRRLQLALEQDAHELRPGRADRLRREDVLGLAGADAPGERAERTDRAGMAVAAQDREPGLRDPLLRRDDVNDALVAVLDAEDAHAEFAGMLVQRVDQRVGALDGRAGAPLGGRDQMVDDGEGELGMADLVAGLAHVREGERGVQVVQQVAVDVDEVDAAVERGDDMPRPDAVEIGLSHGLLPACDAWAGSPARWTAPGSRAG